MPAWVKNSGTWREVRPDGLWVKHSGTWRQVQGGWVKHSGTWRKFHTLSDPVTLTFYPNYTQPYMYNGSKAVGSVLSGVSDNDCVQGYWETGQTSPAGTWYHVTTLISFHDIAGNLAIRPVVKSAVLRMGLKVGYGGTPLSSRLVLGGYTTAAGAAPGTFGHTDTAKGLQETSATIWTGEGQVKEVALNADMLNGIENLGRYGIALHDTTHGASETRKRETRTIWYGASAATNLRPQLEITCDYV